MGTGEQGGRDVGDDITGMAGRSQTRHHITHAYACAHISESHIAHIPGNYAIHKICNTVIQITS